MMPRRGECPVPSPTQGACRDQHQGAGHPGRGADAPSRIRASPASGVTSPGTITLDYRTPVTLGSVALATAFGQGQGVTGLDVQTWNGSTWVTLVSGAALTWSSNTSTVETRTITLPTPIATSKVQLVVHAANLQWGDFAVNDVTTG